MVGTYTEGDEPVPGFRLTQLLGWGRFGEVWKASGPGGITVAVKIIPLSSRHGLKEFRAIRLVKEIRHPNIVPIMAFWLKDRQGNFIDDSLADDAESLHALACELIIVMGLGEKSLHDRLVECAQSGRCGIPLEELLSYMLDAARAIDYLNRRAHLIETGPAGIQHCDIKPHNILIVGGVAQVCDLGVARVMEDTRGSAVTGSAAYIAPEFLRSGKPSQATDQYSLAVTYVELRTGLLPFQARSAAAAYLVHLNGELDLSGLSAPEQSVIERATAADSSERYPTCAVFVKALQEACALIPPEELALVDGIARLNASGLVAGEQTSRESRCFGPFHTAAISECDEDLALSDNEESMTSFVKVGCANQRPAAHDETDTVEMRAPANRNDVARCPTSRPESPFTGPIDVPASSQSSWKRMALSYSSNMAKFSMWNSRNHFNGNFAPKQLWKDLPPRYQKFIRYGSQFALLAVLGIVAGQATSSFSAAERAGSDSRTASPSTRKGEEKAIAHEPGNQGRYDAIASLRAEGQYAQALAALDKAIAAHPGDSMAHLYRAELKAECGQLNQALEDARLAAKERPDDPTVRACLARIYLARGDFAQARSECEQVLKYDFKNSQVLYMRSQALTGMKEYARALADYRSARQSFAGSWAIQPATALAVASGGLIMDACRGGDLKSQIELCRDRKVATPRTMEGGPAATLSLDGNLLAFSVNKQDVKVVDLSGQRHELLLHDANASISALLFVRDGRWLASASEDRVIRLWDTETGKVAQVLEGHSGPIASLAYSSLGDLLASGSADQNIKLWNLKDGTCVRTMIGHQANITALAFAPLDRLLASGGTDRVIRLWDSATGAEVSTLEGHSAEVTSLAFSKDGRVLASGSADLTWPLWPGQIKLWNTVTGSIITTFGGHPHGVYKVAFEPESNRLVSAGADFELRSWDVTPFVPETTFAKKPPTAD
jgi:serine/threonine protein kinase